MSWEEIWSKYESQIVQEEYRKQVAMDRYEKIYGKKMKGATIADEETLTERIYMRILEKSCATNKAFDNIFLKQDGTPGNLASIAARLELDVRSLLGPKDAKDAMKEIEKVHKKLEKEERKQREREEKRLAKAMKELQKEEQLQEQRRAKAVKELKKKQQSDNNDWQI